MARRAAKQPRSRTSCVSLLAMHMAFRPTRLCVKLPLPPIAYKTVRLKTGRNWARRFISIPVFRPTARKPVRPVTIRQRRFAIRVLMWRTARFHKVMTAKVLVTGMRRWRLMRNFRRYSMSAKMVSQSGGSSGMGVRLIWPSRPVGRRLTRLKWAWPISKP